jgi:hypothetical protein
VESSIQLPATPALPYRRLPVSILNPEKSDGMVILGAVVSIVNETGDCARELAANINIKTNKYFPIWIGLILQTDRIRIFNLLK